MLPMEEAEATDPNDFHMKHPHNERGQTFSTQHFAADFMAAVSGEFTSNMANFKINNTSNGKAL
jgi:hypothetical protein